MPDSLPDYLMTNYVQPNRETSQLRYSDLAPKTTYNKQVFLTIDTAERRKISIRCKK